jgi:hypothetical protein
MDNILLYIMIGLTLYAVITVMKCVNWKSPKTYVRASLVLTYAIVYRCSSVPTRYELAWLGLGVVGAFFIVRVIKKYWQVMEGKEG